MNLKRSKQKEPDSKLSIPHEPREDHAKDREQTGAGGSGEQRGGAEQPGIFFKKTRTACVSVVLLTQLHLSELLTTR